MKRLYWPWLLVFILVACGSPKQVIPEIGVITVAIPDGTVLLDTSTQADYYVTNNSTLVEIEGFTKPLRFQLLKLVFGDGNTRLLDSESVRIMGSIEFDGQPGDALTFVFLEDRNYWVEVDRHLR